jgi:hypothetical protein
LNYININSHSPKPKNAKIIATVTLEGTRKGRKPHKRCVEEVEENLNIKEITGK